MGGGLPVGKRAVGMGEWLGGSWSYALSYEFQSQAARRDVAQTLLSAAPRLRTPEVVPIIVGCRGKWSEPLHGDDVAQTLVSAGAETHLGAARQKCRAGRLKACATSHGSPHFPCLQEFGVSSRRTFVHQEARQVPSRQAEGRATSVAGKLRPRSGLRLALMGPLVGVGRRWGVGRRCGVLSVGVGFPRPVRCATVPAGACPIPCFRP